MGIWVLILGRFPLFLFLPSSPLPSLCFSLPLSLVSMYTCAKACMWRSEGHFGPVLFHLVVLGFYPGCQAWRQAPLSAALHFTGLADSSLWAIVSQYSRSVLVSLMGWPCSHTDFPFSELDAWNSKDRRVTWPWVQGREPGHSLSSWHLFSSGDSVSNPLR